MRGVVRALGVLILLVLLAVAGAITTSRLLEPPGRVWAQLEAFTPYGLVLYAVLLLLALVWAARARRAGRIVPAVLLLVAALGLGAHVSWFLPQVTGANPPPASGAERLRVMTANLSAGEGDAIGLVERASDEGADVLVVQEVTPAALEDMRSAGLDDLFPHDAGDPADGVRGTMVFSAFELGEPQPLETRMASFQVSVAAPDGELQLVAVHPAPPTQDSWVDEHRAVTDWVRAHDPDLVVGDLNATADHRPLRNLSAAGYRSVTELTNIGWRPTWPADRALPPYPLVQVDHVLVGPRLAAISSHTLPIDGSDHRGLLAEVAAK